MLITLSRRSRWRKWVQLNILLLFLALFLPAAKAGPSVALQQTPTYVQLYRKARVQGSVSVIVRVRANFQPEGTLRRLQSVTRQRHAITAAQQTVLATLNDSNITDVSNVRTYTFIPYMALTVNADALQQLASLPQVVGIQEDVLAPSALANSTALIGADQVWDVGYSGTGWTIAVLDTGVDGRHPFLMNKVVDEACFSTTVSSYGATTLCPNRANSQTGNGAAINCTGIINCDHGTHIAGIVAGKGTSFSGVAKNSTLIAIQIYSRFDNTYLCGGSLPCLLSYTSDQLAALEHVFNLRDMYHIAAVNLSLGGNAVSTPCDYSPLKDAIDSLRAADIVTVISAGNEGYADALDTPACISSAISVGASTLPGDTGDEAVAAFSNSAAFLDLLAPGQDIISSVPGGGYAQESGTSIATAHVAGAWAVLKSYAPTASVDEIFTALIATAHPITDTRNHLVFPRLQLDKALTVLPAPSPTPIALTPHIAGISQPEGNNLQATTVSITGSNFWGPPNVQLNTTPLDYVTLVSASELRATVPSHLPPATYDLTVTNPDGQRAVYNAAFTVSTVYEVYLPLVVR